jgi:transposase, IS6 family
MAERNLTVDHTTVWRWVQAYAPEIRKRLQGQLKYKHATWFMDETYVRVAGRWMYLFRAVDNRGDTVDFYLSETRDRDAAKRFLQTALAIRTTGRRACFLLTETAATEQPFAICAMTVSLSASAATDARATETTASNPIIGTSNAAGEPCRERAPSQPHER